MREVTRKRYYIAVFGICIIVITLYFTKAIFSSDGIVRLPLNSNVNCSVPLQKSVTKVASYYFPFAKDYPDLFTGQALNFDSMPDKPVMLAAFSSNHFEEGLTLIRNISGLVTEMKLKFIIYDIGLSQGEITQISQMCSCEVRTFPFQDFPDFVKELPTYTFKPLAVQLVARDHPFVIWLDTSVRFTTTNLKPLFDKAHKHGVLFTRTDGSVAQRTHPATFKFLKELPCTFRSVPELQATVLVIYGSQFVRDHFIKPWASCALSFGCMNPDHNSVRFLNCHKYGEVYHDCHRFDQSVVGILLYRLFFDEIEEHLIHNDVLIIDKSK